MVNAWREHVKRTMDVMKLKASGTTVMLKDVLKAAGKTYKKAGTLKSSIGKRSILGKSNKRKSNKRKSNKRNTRKHR